MKRKTERIDGVVKSVMEGLDRHSNPAAEDIEAIWRGVSGKKAASHTKPASLRKKCLVVNVDGSSWLYELTLRKGELLKNLKKKLGNDKIKTLQFRIGEL